MLSRLIVAAAFLALPLAAAVPAGAAEAPLRVSVSVDQSKLVVELDAAGNPVTQPALTYEVVVENPSDALISGVEVVADFPAGTRLPVGDLPASSAWRGTFAATVDHRQLRGSRLSSTATAVLPDGTRVEGAPAVTTVSVISATSQIRSDRAATAQASPTITPQIGEALTVQRSDETPLDQATTTTAAPRAAVETPVTPIGTRSRVLGTSVTADARLARTGTSTRTLLLAAAALLTTGFAVLWAGTVLLRPRSAAE